MIFQRAQDTRHGSPGDQLGQAQPVPRAAAGPGAVRYMSVHSWKQPDSHRHNGTSLGPSKSL
jgi:hypothetical protein